MHIFTNHAQILNNNTYIWISPRLCLYKLNFDGRTSTNVTFWDIYFLDYDIVGNAYLYFLGYNVRIVVDFHLAKQKSFGPGKTYIAVSRLNTCDNIFGVGEFKKFWSKMKQRWITWIWTPETNFIFQNKKEYLFIQYPHNSF